MKKILIAVIGLSAVSLAGVNGQVIFSQNFESSTVLADYISATPNSGQWNAISSSGANTTVSVADNNLSFTRNGANTGTFSRTTDFNPLPEGILYRFNLSISNNTVATTSAATFQVGSGFGTTNSAESNANTYARFSLNFTANSGEFAFRDVTNSVNSSAFSGTQSVLWVLNNSGSTLNYVNPLGGTSSIDNDKASIWAGNNLLFDNVNVQTTTQTIADLKFVFSAGSGTITMDNFEITAIPEPSTWALIGLGIGFVLWQIRRKQSEV